MNPSADDLITRIQTNDPACFKDIVSWYAADVLRLAYFLLQNRSEAEDVFQEAAIRLIRQARNGALRAQNGSIKGFLMKCARNICIDRLRKQKRLPVRNEGHAQIESAACERKNARPGVGQNPAVRGSRQSPQTTARPAANHPGSL